MSSFTGERLICINAESGKDNKFAGKMAGPYAQLVPLGLKDTAAAVPHIASQIHILKLSGDVSSQHHRAIQNPSITTVDRYD